MVAEVSSLNRNPNALITQDLLVGLSRPGNNEDHFDLMSGKAYLRGSYSPVSPMSSSSSSGDNMKQGTSAPAPELQDLNYPPTNTLVIGDTSYWSLELKLDSPCSSGSTRSNYQSVCTLDKVKSALQRAEQETVINKRASQEAKTTPCSGMFAAACPGCLLYVITQKTNPKCPRCNSTVPCPPPAKKPRFDLNAMQQFD